MFEEVAAKVAQICGEGRRRCSLAAWPRGAPPPLSASSLPLLPKAATQLSHPVGPLPPPQATSMWCS